MHSKLTRGSRVVLSRPWKKAHHGQVGTITDLDRGTVFVKLDNGETICTRKTNLREPDVLDKLANAL